MKTRPYTHIYLSPHLDDVVLSCGGAIYEQVQAGGKVLVASFFAGSPADGELTPFTRELKERWGGARDPVAVRRQEDLDALHVLGAAGLHLGFVDCVYRYAEVQSDPPEHLAYYPTREHIFGSVHPHEAGWHRELGAALLAQMGPASLDAAVCYAPLAAGHHVDHILVQRVAFLLLERGLRVLFYEDYPYAGDSRIVGEALAEHPGQPWGVQTVFLGEEALRAKGGAVACYTSQISTFWASPKEMRQALRSWALAVGRGRYAENYWQRGG